MKALQNSVQNMEKQIKESQETVAESLKQLSQNIEKQRNDADQSEIEKWDILQEEVTEEQKEIDELKATQEQVSATIDNIKDILNDAGRLTNNRQMQHVGSKLGHANGLIKTFIKMFHKDDTSNAPQSQQRQPTIQPIRKPSTPCPPIPSSPPPRRLSPSPPNSSSIHRSPTFHMTARQPILASRQTPAIEQQEEGPPTLPPRASVILPLVNSLTKRTPPPLPPRKLTEAALASKLASDTASYTTTYTRSITPPSPQTQTSIRATGPPGNKCSCQITHSRPKQQFQRVSVPTNPYTNRQNCSIDANGSLTIRDRARQLERQLRLLSNATA
ncbi:hypothetical protein EJ08DRAFT_23447 [Tothia fuscella]|uniref:Uncharacterized protein n=1 Tax=Tothia fuscella TaxID=1048955 RepID=A0A9P4NZA8_9PEZI|nr:hypothetical protein EJ08DRAFT_23447 [Tothia fuscella]